MRTLIHAELIKVARQRGALFWGFFALPCFLIVLAFALDGNLGPEKVASVEIHPVRIVLRALAAGGNPIGQLLFAVGASALFALEYRHSTWRLIVPKHRRSALLIGKLVAFLLLAGVSFALLTIGNLVSIYVLPTLRGTHTFTNEQLGAGGIAIALAFAVALLDVAALAAMVAMFAVITRSTVGAILPPFALVIGSASTRAYLGDDSGWLLVLPGAATDQLRSTIAIGFETSAGSPQNQMGLAIVVALAWLVVPLGAALLLFAQQDLATE